MFCLSHAFPPQIFFAHQNLVQESGIFTPLRLEFRRGDADCFLMLSFSQNLGGNLMILHPLRSMVIVPSPSRSKPQHSHCSHLGSSYSPWKSHSPLPFWEPCIPNRDRHQYLIAHLLPDRLLIDYALTVTPSVLLETVTSTLHLLGTTQNHT